MATIAGSQFDATASAITFPGGVNVVETSTGTGLPAAIPTDFNLEVYTGPAAGAPTTPFSGYQGLAILGPGGYSIELFGSGYAVTDDGSGGAMLTTASTATGDTITGGGGFDNLILNGTGNTANGGSGGGYIEVDGNGNTVNTGTGAEAVNVFSDNDTVNVGSGNDDIYLGGNNTTVSGGTGADTITATGNNEVISAGTGSELINASGTGTSITAGSGNDTINVFGAGDTVTGGSGADTIGVYGSSESVNFSNVDTANVSGNLDTVTAGAGAGTNTGTVNLNGATNFTFNDGPNVYSDTVTGFSTAAGDTIHLTGSDTEAFALANASSSGGNTLITLNDGSKILLVGVSSIDSSFFS